MIREASSSSELIIKLVADALRRGGNELDVEYKDGYESVSVMKANVGVGIAAIPSSGDEARELRKRLYAMTKKRETISIQGKSYRLKTEIYDSFGEDAFRVSIHEK